MSDIAQAVAGTVADLFGGGPDEAATTVVEQPNADASETVHEPATTEVVSFADLNPDLPEDIEELLEAPDDDEIDQQYVAQEDLEYADPDELARENARLRKRIEFAEQQKVKANQKAWAAEAKKIAPLSRPETINATSRRSFLKQAREQHNQNFDLLKPHIDAYNEAKTTIRQQVEQEVKAELAAAWGKPTVATTAPVVSGGNQDALEKARASRNLAGVAKALMDTNNI